MKEIYWVRMGKIRSHGKSRIHFIHLKSFSEDEAEEKFQLCFPDFIWQTPPLGPIPFFISDNQKADAHELIREGCNLVRKHFQKKLHTEKV